MTLTSPARPGLATTAYDTAPTRTLADGTPQWICRSANFVVVMSRVQPGAELSRPASAQSDEYFVLLPAQVCANVSAADASVEAAGDALLIVPPGQSTVTALTEGWIYQVFSCHAQDLCQLADNHEVYRPGVSDVSSLETWPEPLGGYQLRHYKLADYVRSNTTMRLFRTCHLMINIFVPGNAPRDPKKMSPHSHDDFEQGSLAVQGEWIHHMRYPWTPDMTVWREDEHVKVGSPSVFIIPPNAIHTSQSVGTPPMALVDIFAPPRDDFSLKADLVCNANEYPLPERLRNDVAAAHT